MPVLPLQLKDHRGCGTQVRSHRAGWGCGPLGFRLGLSVIPVGTRGGLLCCKGEWGVIYEEGV